MSFSFSITHIHRFVTNFPWIVWLHKTKRQLSKLWTPYPSVIIKITKLFIMRVYSTFFHNGTIVFIIDPKLKAVDGNTSLLVGKPYFYVNFIHHLRISSFIVGQSSNRLINLAWITWIIQRIINVKCPAMRFFQGQKCLFLPRIYCLSVFPAMAGHFTLNETLNALVVICGSSEEVVRNSSSAICWLKMVVIKCCCFY